MQELISVEAKLPTLEVNWDEIRDHLKRQLLEYNIVVTPETVKDAKGAATELNKLKKTIDDTRKEEIRRVSEPINEFDSNMKSLTSEVEEARQRILEQVQVFENEQLEKAREKLHEKLESEWDNQEVQSEFRTATVQDLVKLGALTDKGNLAKNAREAVEQRVRENRALQDRTDKRLLELENRSYRAGLKTPLERRHVEHFLFSDDATYESSLDSILSAEVERQRETERQIEDEAAERQQREQERKQAEEARQQEHESRQEPEPSAGSQEAPAPTAEATERDPQPRPAPQASGDKEIATVTATFEVPVGRSVSDQAIEAELRRVMESAGITTLTSIRVERDPF